MSGNGDDKSPGANNVWHCQHSVAGSHQTPIIPGTANAGWLLPEIPGSASAEWRESSEWQKSLAVPISSGVGAHRGRLNASISAVRPPHVLRFS